MTINESMRKENLQLQAMKIAGPAMVESAFTSVVGIIDSMMVSALGTHAVAAVGLCNQPKLVAFSFFFAMNTAISSLVARRKGEGEQQAVHHILFIGIVIGMAAGGLIGGLCYLLADEIIRFCGSTPETHREAVLYFRIIMAGILFQVVPLIINTAMRGIGRTKSVMYLNLFSQCVNLAGNYLLIEGRWCFPALGIAGAAISTVFAAAVSLVLVLATMGAKDAYIRWDKLLGSGIGNGLAAAKGILKLGWPLLTEQLLMRIGFLATAIMAAQFGADAFAVNHAGMNIFTLTYAFGEGMQVAVVSLVGQSLGEKRIAMARQYVKALMGSGIVLSAAIACLYIIGARFYMGFYFKEVSLIETGRQIMYINGVVAFVQMIQQISTGSLKGGGDVLFITWSTIISVTIIRPLSTYLFCYPAGLGILGFWFGLLIDQCCRLLLNTWRYRRGIWTRISI